VLVTEMHGLISGIDVVALHTYICGGFGPLVVMH